MNEGKMYVIEGLDGTGKDSLIDKLISEYRKINKECIVVQDPSPEVANEIRWLLLNNPNIENSTRLYLYLAARSELVHKQILPALKEGKIVICNRFSLSTHCYQGIHFTKEMIDMAHMAGGLDIVKPDLQIVLLSRRSFREAEQEDVMGQYCNSFRQEIAERYLELAKNPEFNIEVIWADNKTVEDVYQEVVPILFKVA